MQTSLFGSLVSYIPSEKRKPQEDYLTEIFAYLLAHVGGYAYRYVQELCSRAKLHCPDEKDAEITVSTQEPVSSGRIDLVLRVNRDALVFLCEHKVDSPLSGSDQLVKYRNSADALAAQKCCIVYLTKSAAQQSPDADIHLVWRDVFALTKPLIAELSGEEKYLLQEFTQYLTEKGMGEQITMQNETLTHYYAVTNLKGYFSEIFRELADEAWEHLAAENAVSKAVACFQPQFHKERWGRIGMYFSPEWNPGIFAGILFDWEEHHMPPLDASKGPDFVVFLESDYTKNKKNDEIRKKYQKNRAQADLWYQRLKQMLQADDGGFSHQPGIDESPWRLIVLRKPLYDVLSGAETREAHKDQLRAHMQTAVELLLKSAAECVR